MRSPAIIMYDGYGNPLATLENNIIFSDQPGLLFAGKDENGLVRFFSVTSSGVIKTALVGEREEVGEYYFGSNLIIGAGAVQTLVTLENPIASGRSIYLNNVVINGTLTGTFTSAFAYTLARTTGLPTSGAIQVSQKRNTSDLDPVGIVKQASVVTAATGSLWTGSPGVTGNKGSFFQTLTQSIAAFQEKREVVLASGEAVVIMAGPNDTNWFHWVNLHWNEA